MDYGTHIPWAECYRDVARMRLDIEVISDDIEFTKTNDKKILYVVDTNVVCFYADPLKHSDFSRIFADDDDSLLQGLSIALADFIFIKGLFSEEGQALLLPLTMVDEFIDVYDRFLFDARKEVIKNTSEEKINQINQTLSCLNTTNDIISFLVAKCSDLIKYMSPYDYESNTGAIKRLGKLGMLSRLRNLDPERGFNFLDTTKLNKTDEWKSWDRKFKEVVKKDEEENEGNENYKRRLSWHIENDIDTLALISILNKSNDSIKIVYLSCDKLVHQASRELNDPSLGLDFLRQPYQYIPFIRFDGLHKTKQVDRQKNIVRLKLALNDFLSPLRLNEKEYKNQLYEIVNDWSIAQIDSEIFSFRNINITKHYYDDLKNAREELLSLNNLLNDNSSYTLHEIAGIITEKLLDGQTLEELLNKRQQEVFGQTTSFFTEIGVGKNFGRYANEIRSYLKGVNNSGDSARGPVTLRRHPNNNGDDFFEDIHNRVYKKDIDSSWGYLWDKMEGSTLYIRELIIALVAADANEWHQAKLHCERALENERRNGNEALYFLAVALRHTCESIDDYLDAKRNLNEFRKTWDRRYGQNGVEKIFRPDYRFESEKLSLQTAFFNYKEFQDKTFWDSTKLDVEPDIKVTWKSLILLSNKIDEVGDHELNDVVRGRIKRQVFSSKCCLFLVDQYLVDKKIDEGEGLKAYEELNELALDTEFRSSYFINFLLAFIKWHFKKDDFTWNNANKMTQKALEKSKIPYEVPKYNRFLKILEDNTKNTTD